MSEYNVSVPVKDWGQDAVLRVTAATTEAAVEEAKTFVSERFRDRFDWTRAKVTVPQAGPALVGRPGIGTDYYRAYRHRMDDVEAAALQQANDAQPDSDIIMPPLPEEWPSYRLAMGDDSAIDRIASDVFCSLFVDTLRARIATIGDPETAAGLEKLACTFRYGRESKR